MKKILSLLLVSSSLFSMEDNTWEPMWDIMSAYDSPSTPVKKPEIKYIKDKKIDVSSVFVPHNIRPAELMYTKKIFSVLKDNKKYNIEKYLMDPELRNINKKELNSLLQNAHLALNVTDDSDITLKVTGGILGGGYRLGLAGYWVTKAVCWTVVSAAVVGLVVVKVATGNVGTNGRVMQRNPADVYVQEANAKMVNDITTGSIGLGIGNMGVSVGTSLGAEAMYGATICTGPIAAGGIAGGYLAGQGYGETAAKIVVATGIEAQKTHPAGLVGAIETISMTVGAFCGMVPGP